MATKCGDDGDTLSFVWPRWSVACPRGVNYLSLGSSGAWQAPTLLDSELVESWHYGKAWGGWPEFDGKSFVSQAHSSAGTPLIISHFKHRNGADYLAVVNNSQNKTTQAKIVVTGQKPDLYRVSWENTETPFARYAARAPNYGEDYIKVFFNLAPGQMELFRIGNKSVAG